MNLTQKKRLFNIVVSRLLEKNANPQTELQHTNNFTLLIAVMLSAQTTDKTVNKATKNIFNAIASPQDLLNISQKDLEAELKTINFYKTKVRNIIATSQQIITKFNGNIPSDLSDLTSLPGVGIKTAKVVLSAIYNKPFIATDTHIARVSQRLGLTKNTNPDKISLDLESLANKSNIQYAHHLIVLHGRYICKAKSPLCKQCPIGDLCKYDLKTT